MPHTGLHLSNVSLDIMDGATERRLLDEISLDVAPSEIVGVTGPSGSGKSTLLAIAGCLQPATSGEVWLDDTNLGVTGAQAARIRRNKIGVVFQRANLLPSLSVLEQLTMMSRLGRILPLPRAERIETEQRARRLLNDVGLSDMAERRIGELSGGQQARVNLARALMNDPALLLVDEPTAALDSHTADVITDLILVLAHDLRTPTLYVSHDTAQIAKLDRTIHIVDGRVQELVTS